jgi:hypothetical protein
MKCLNCGKDDCDVFIFEGNDIFDQTWLRLCDKDCFYEYMFEFLYESGYRYEFKEWLIEKELPQDIEEKKKELKNFYIQAQENLKKIDLNKDLLINTPPYDFSTIYSKCTSQQPVKTFRFKRPTKEDIIEGTRQRIAQLEKDLFLEKQELTQLMANRCISSK